MRYKFRGKQLEDIKETEKRYGSEKGTWRYGSYVYAHKYRGGEHAHLICNIYGEDCVMCDKDTIGQFTGLLDKNGKEIYEGDVIQYKNDYNGAYKKTVIKMGKIVINNDLFYALTNTWEIIGNVHDKGEEHE